MKWTCYPVHCQPQWDEQPKPKDWTLAIMAAVVIIYAGVGVWLS